MLAYIAEGHNKPVNVFDVVLEMILSSKIVLSFEQAITVALWSLHSCTYHHFMHTPRLLVESYEPGCGKTALGMLVNALACNTFFTSSTSAAAIYYRLRQCQHCTLIVDEVEHSALWGQEKLLLSIFDAGHRKGGRVTRVIGGEVVEFPAFAPLMLMAVWQRPFAPQLLSRSILLHMEKHPEGRDEVDPNDPRFLPARAAQAQWASEFQRPKDCELPRELVGRAGDNWRPLVEIGATLGYPATVRPPLWRRTSRRLIRQRCWFGTSIGYSRRARLISTLIRFGEMSLLLRCVNCRTRSGMNMGSIRVCPREC